MVIFIGCIFTIKNAEEVYFSIPFVRLKQESVIKKNLLFDASILSDPRIIDLASSGLIDNQIIVPRYLIEDLKKTSENTDEMISARAKKALVVYKKLEDLPHLNLRLTDYDFPEIPEESEKLIRIARLTCSDIFTADLDSIKNLQMEDIRMINIHSLSNALKPLMQTGEHIQIIIQRYGKEPRQGVGYLDDGTMVVVNGGGEFIGKSIDALVLSVKHTSSGRMIFCNVVEKKAPETTYFKEDAILAKNHE